MSKRRLDGEKTKQHIVEKATELFSQKGYSATSIEDICQATGASKGSLYYHFKNKEQLFLYLLEKQYNEWEYLWQEKEKEFETSIDKLYGLAVFFLEDYLSHPLKKAGEEFSGSQLADPVILEQVLEMLGSTYTLYTSLFQEGIDRGEFAPCDPEEMAMILEGLMNGIINVGYQMEDERLYALLKRSIDVLLHGIAAK
ncbi:TetR family transcriptional regulator [Brevibacillus sp. HB1.2]|uniref:TetR/AcrR family transcriptional regulator n=1 Tax=Brevibacillus TaxID=55080 RepID=UPI00036C06FC|nr:MULTISPECIES: TetR/AcrR family transcriptional regulator [unclassified Brevibacillus]ATF12741.1 transcriptional regulator [Brevibacillus brevis X23]NRS20369.1 TetR family transcriptional regulator [Brevibacillus sp. HB1.4B]NTU19559.1 TetR family transcriptional regulator [Brevibacillus sp. HB1.2]NTU30365.1 TetR family transcriptional regulator [Brevibacillus sp. HB1.1]